MEPKKLTPDEAVLQQQGNWVKEMTETNGWKEVIAPLLKDKIKHTWVDPRKSRSDDKLLYEYKLAWAFATVAQELVDYIEKMKSEAEALTQKEQGGGEIDKLRESLS